MGLTKTWSISRIEPLFGISPLDWEGGEEKGAFTFEVTFHLHREALMSWSNSRITTFCWVRSLGNQTNCDCDASDPNRPPSHNFLLLRYFCAPQRRFDGPFIHSIEMEKEASRDRPVDRSEGKKFCHRHPTRSHLCWFAWQARFSP